MQVTSEKHERYKVLTEVRCHRHPYGDLLLCDFVAQQPTHILGIFYAIVIC
jgi:hypothetical protein